MSGSIVAVAPGVQPTQLAGSNLANYVLYNTDTVNSVWVGNSPSVSPNHGMRIGPLGTLNWQKSAGLAYACVNTGVTTPVLLNVSNDVTDIVNPVDVATATAIQILAHGVPSVILNTVLMSQPLATNTLVNIDTTGQASVTIRVANNGNIGNNVLQILWIDDNFNTIENYFLTVPYDSTTNNGSAAWNLPVMSNKLQVFNVIGSPNLNVFQVIGSNQSIPHVRQMINNFVPRTFSFNGNFTAGVPIFLQPSDGIAGENAVTRYNGPIKTVLFGNAAAHTAPGFQLAMAYATPGDAGNVPLDGANLYPQSTTNEVRDWIHPCVPVMWRVTPGATVAGAQISMQVIPSGSGQ